MVQHVPRSPQCLIRPATRGDRRAVNRLIDQFYRSLQPHKPWWTRPLPNQGVGAIAVAMGLLLVLILYGFYSHAVALGLIFALALRANQWIDRSLSNVWVVEWRGNVIGCAKLFCYETHSEAYLVYIDAQWRGQGHGSCLVQRLTQEAILPLYLASQPHRVPFYTRLRFVPVPTKAVPDSIRVNLGLDRYPSYNIQALVFKAV
ncbi:GNAT family N-acetyltransferase [Stenomitos frigidus]|uniref:N-acetyltransferase domain-containing protein n=1 Tax=Stenomitos frigidus ULC18 TaxID=2107698 RepID=A0A2T1EBG4_9CYAN|nr:GNAT family N-acetyltransferase [Stenomitos frigidus]PSB30048.1 hypothetical protein C7B82_09760 [Stenomitos frigidus ULC18]